MKQLLPRLFALIACLFLFAACMGSPKVNSIEISLSGVAPSPKADTLILTIRYTNANVIPIAIAHTDHKLSLNGRVVGKVESEKAVGLPPTKAIEEKVELTIKDPALIQELRTTAASKTASYVLDTVIYIEDGEDDLVSKTSSTGAVDLSALAAGN